jgi:hypothetical protein
MGYIVRFQEQSPYEKRQPPGGIIDSIGNEE